MFKVKIPKLFSLYSDAIRSRTTVAFIPFPPDDDPRDIRIEENGGTTIVESNHMVTICKGACVPLVRGSKVEVFAKPRSVFDNLKIKVMGDDEEDEE